MPQNRVLFQIGTEPWTLAGFCVALGLAMLVIGAGLFTLLVVRHGRTRRLEGLEASRVAANAGPGRSDVGMNYGPAVGVEARLTFTIGDLRRAHRAGDDLMFWGAPAMMLAWIAGFGLSLFAAVVWLSESILLVGFILIVPMFLIVCFMPWAAVHTQLE
jgi:hypothetical protein